MLGLQSNVEIGGRSGFIFNTKTWTSDHAGGSEQLSEKYCQCL